MKFHRDRLYIDVFQTVLFLFVYYFRVQPKIVNLALQGGGAHGAFTWGVLDRLLEDTRIQIDGVSATSAGAMNAVVLAHGLTSAQIAALFRTR